MFSEVKSIRGNACAQLFTNGKFVHLEPITRKALAGEALQSMVDEVGIPDKLVFDGAKEQVGAKSEFMATVRRYRMATWRTEPYSPWQNRAEDQIREVRRRWRLLRQRKRIPPRLWDYAMVHKTKLMNMTARGANGRTGYEEITNFFFEFGHIICSHFIQTIFCLQSRQYFTCMSFHLKLSSRKCLCQNVL